MSKDLFQAPDYYQLDELLTEEHKMVRDAARDWVKKEISPIIEECCQEAKFPQHIKQGLGEIGAFGPYIPEEYGGAGLDQISYGLIMQEIRKRRFWSSFYSICSIIFSYVSNLEVRKLKNSVQKVFTKISFWRMDRLFSV